MRSVGRPSGEAASKGARSGTGISSMSVSGTGAGSGTVTRGAAGVGAGGAAGTSGAAGRGAPRERAANSASPITLTITAGTGGSGRTRSHGRPQTASATTAAWPAADSATPAYTVRPYPPSGLAREGRRTVNMRCMAGPPTACRLTPA